MANNEFTIPIPARLKNVAKGGHVAGAQDIIDDELGLEQSVINKAVFGNAITVGFSASPATINVGSSTDVTFTATSTKVEATSILIKKDNDILKEGSGSALNATAAVNPTDDAGSTFKAEFAIGGLSRISNLRTIFFGFGDAEYSDNVLKKASLKSGVGGTYTVNVTAANSYVWFVVPNSMTISKATKSGFNYPLESAQNVTVGGAAYKAYRTKNTYDVGNEVVVLS